MNSYEENLRASVAKTLSDLTARDADLAAGYLKAQDALYHAKGNVLAADDQLELRHRQRDMRAKADQAAQRALDQAASLQDCLTGAKQGCDNAISNAVTTAANLQASADAVTQLSSSVGGALNLVSASLYDTELYHQLLRVNEHLSLIANQARHLALLGTEVSTKSAESIAVSLSDQGKGLLGQIDALHGKTLADLSASENDIQDSQKALQEAHAQELAAESSLRSSGLRHKAMDGALADAMRWANLSLSATVLSAHQISLSFSPVKLPLWRNKSAQTGQTIPTDAATYLLILPQDRVDQFSSDYAHDLFGKWNGKSGIFTPVSPGESVITLHLDAFGAQVQPGVAYSALLYIEPNAAYKRHVGNYADHLSIATPPFTPQSPLPGPLFAGASAESKQLLLAWPADQHPHGLQALEAAKERLAPHLAWLLKDGAQLPAAIASALDTVVPPFAASLDTLAEAVKNRDAAASQEANSAAQDLLAQTTDWQDWHHQHDHGAEVELNALIHLLYDIGGLLARASAALTQDSLSLRCILLDQAADAALAPHAPSVFNLSIAQQVAPANTILAKVLEEAPDGAQPPAALKGKGCRWYAVEIADDDNDSYGNQLLPGHRYTPYILASMGDANSGEWADSLTAIDHVWQLA